MSVQTVGPVRAHGMVFDVAGGSEQGPRNENQDAFLVQGFERGGVLAVADGMGGEQGGKLAAETAIGTLAQRGPVRSLDEARFAIRSADEAVARAATGADGERMRMGCALAVLSLAADRGGQVGWIGAHVGDVRIISRGPDGTVRLETRDHTPAYARWEAGEIGLDEIPDSPLANRLQRAVGHGGEADTAWLPARPGWAYLLISDGVTKATRLDELGEALALPSARAAVDAILRKVDERGPDDNFTAVVVRIGADGAAAAPPERTDDNATIPHPGRATAEAGARRNPFDPPSDVTRTTRSPLAGLATGLSVLALAVGGFALFTAMQARDAATTGTADVARLRTEVDSVRHALPPAPAAADTLHATGDSAHAAAPPVPLTARPVQRAGGRP